MTTINLLKLNKHDEEVKNVYSSMKSYKKYLSKKYEDISKNDDFDLDDKQIFHEMSQEILSLYKRKAKGNLSKILVESCLKEKTYKNLKRLIRNFSSQKIKEFLPSLITVDLLTLDMDTLGVVYSQISSNTKMMETEINSVKIVKEEIQIPIEMEHNKSMFLDIVKQTLAIGLKYPQISKSFAIDSQTSLKYYCMEIEEEPDKIKIKAMVPYEHDSLIKQLFSTIASKFLSIQTHSFTLSTYANIIKFCNRREDQELPLTELIMSSEYIHSRMMWFRANPFPDNEINPFLLAFFKDGGTIKQMIFSKPDEINIWEESETFTLFVSDREFIVNVLNKIDNEDALQY